MTTIEILRKARDHIAQPGMWWQGGYFADAGNEADRTPRDGPCCLLGAICWAGGPDAGAMGAPAVAFIETAVLESGALIPPELWNDAPGRTQYEVVALFDRAIELAEREATP